MTFVELLLGWAIVTLLGIGSIVSAEPFWGPNRSREQPVPIRLEPERPPPARETGAASDDDERRAA